MYHEFYVERVSRFNEVAAIVYQKTGNDHHYHVIFFEDNSDVYKKICDVELEMYERFSEASFYFTTEVLENKDDEIELTKPSGNIIYKQELTYANQD